VVPARRASDKLTFDKMTMLKKLKTKFSVSVRAPQVVIEINKYMDRQPRTISEVTTIGGCVHVIAFIIVHLLIRPFRKFVLESFLPEI